MSANDRRGRQHVGWRSPIPLPKIRVNPTAWLKQEIPMLNVPGFGKTRMLPATEALLTTATSVIGTVAFALGAAGFALGLAPADLASQKIPSDTLLTVDHYLDFESVGNTGSITERAASPRTSCGRSSI